MILEAKEELEALTTFNQHLCYNRDNNGDQYSFL